MSKLISIIIIVIVFPIIALTFLVIGIIAWIAALGTALALIMAGINWLGWHTTHQLASWHAMVQSLEFAGMCGLVVFVVWCLPMLLAGEPSPVRHQQIAPQYYEKPRSRSNLLWLSLAFWRPR